MSATCLSFSSGSRLTRQSVRGSAAIIVVTPVRCLLAANSFPPLLPAFARSSVATSHRLGSLTSLSAWSARHRRLISRITEDRRSYSVVRLLISPCPRQRFPATRRPVFGFYASLFAKCLCPCRLSARHDPSGYAAPKVNSAPFPISS